MRSMARVGAFFLFSSVILTTLWHSGDTAIAGQSQMATEFESPTWTPSECSFTTTTCTVETQDCCEVCNWTDEEESDGEWTVANGHPKILHAQVLKHMKPTVTSLPSPGGMSLVLALSAFLFSRIHHFAGVLEFRNRKRSLIPAVPLQAKKDGN